MGHLMCCKWVLDDDNSNKFVNIIGTHFSYKNLIFAQGADFECV